MFIYIIIYLRSNRTYLKLINFKDEKLSVLNIITFTLLSNVCLYSNEYLVILFK